MSTKAPSEAKESSAHTPEKAAKAPEKAKVENIAKDTHEKAAATVASAAPAKDADKDTTEYKTLLPYTPQPDAPTKAELGKTFITGASIALPTSVGIPVVSALIASAAYKRVKNLPIIRNIDAGARSLGSGIKNLVATPWKAVTYPFRAGAVLGVNAIKFPFNALGYTWQFAANRYHDHVRDTPGESKTITEKLIDFGTNLPSKFLDIGKTLLESGTHILKSMAAHPIRTVLGVSLAAGILSYNGGVVAFSQNFAEAILQIVQGIAGKIGGGAAATSTAAPAASWFSKWW